MIRPRKQLQDSIYTKLHLNAAPAIDSLWICAYYSLMDLHNNLGIKRHIQEWLTDEN